MHASSSFRRPHVWTLALLILAGCLTLFSTAFAGSAPSHIAARATHTVYLPLATNAGAGAPAPTDPPAADAAGALHLKDLVPLRSADIQVDKQGGLHWGFTAVLSDSNGHRPVYYAYCPPADLAGCARREAWQVAELELESAIVQLALDPRGRPRMLLQSGTFEPVYRYAECNSACASAANWQIAEVAFSPGIGSPVALERSYHSFALDPQGRPRFVFQFSSNDEYYGAYYVSCDAQCIQADNWQYTRLQSGLYVDEAVLAFTPAGQPRIAATNGDIPTRLVYLECDADCTDAGNWSQPTPLWERGAGGQASWSLQLDGQGRPRMAVYPVGGPLFYAWCNAACTVGPSWERTDVGLPDQSGAGVMLALDAQGRPRMAYTDGKTYGIGYLWCDASCEGSSGTWRSRVLETANQLNQAFPIKPFPKCDPGSWFSGLRPMLALDAHGNPRIAYDAEHLQRCYYGDPPNTSYRIETKWWVTRLIFMPQP